MQTLSISLNNSKCNYKFNMIIIWIHFKHYTKPNQIQYINIYKHYKSICTVITLKFILRHQHCRLNSLLHWFLLAIVFLWEGVTFLRLLKYVFWCFLGVTENLLDSLHPQRILPQDLIYTWLQNSSQQVDPCFGPSSLLYLPKSYLCSSKTYPVTLISLLMFVSSTKFVVSASIMMYAFGFTWAELWNPLFCHYDIVTFLVSITLKLCMC